jgi:glycosyltransferase involved in cell wall biosynthesis
MKILFLLNFGFPYGMASVIRARLYAQALKESGAEVEVLSLRYSDWPSQAENTHIRGVYHGIPFQYATGTTIRPDSFVGRRYAELKSLVLSIHRLTTFAQNKETDCVFYYGGIVNKDYSLNFYNRLIHSLGMPHAIEICERPWILEQPNKIKANIFSPLRNVQGCLVISSFLEKWALEEAQRLKSPLIIEKIPILVDFSEFKYPRTPSMAPSVLFAGSPLYSSSLIFILKAMQTVWKIVPGCKLILTGCQMDSPAAAWLQKELGQNSFNNRIDLKGYVNRDELIRLYSQSWALLAPLFDDIRSKARFPTKIGEYMASAVPVITNEVGEIPKFLWDRVNAFISQPDDPAAYAEKIIECLTNASRAEEIGLSGKTVAQNFFCYRKYSENLFDYFTKIAKQ